MSNHFRTKIKFQLIIVGLSVLSCSDSLEKITATNLYTFTNNQQFFPSEVIKEDHFPADSYADKLKQLDEKSLANKYRGHEIIRLTVLKSFSNHFTILIERTDKGIRLTEKETYRQSRTVHSEDTTKIIYNVIEFDSLTGKYMDVRKFMLVGNAIEIEMERMPVEPLLKNESKKVKLKDWNNLIKLLDSTSFYKMYPADTIAMGFDGNHYMIETHSKNGYYVVDRWSPREGNFKKIIEYIVGLTDRTDSEN